jgi:PBSX family phage terminase large subunit
MAYCDVLKMNEKYRQYIMDTFSHKYNYLEGAVRSSKSVINTLAFALYLEQTPDKLHLVIASTVSAARTIVEDGDGQLGLRQYFGSRYRTGRYKDLNAGFIRTPTGEKIVLYLGGEMANAYTKFRGFSIGGVVLEEADLLNEVTIEEAKNRTLLASSPKYFICHNPTSPHAKIYQWLEDLQQRGLVNYCRTTIFDNPALTDERRNEIIAEFDPNSVQYKRYILGQRVVAEDLIYNVTSDNVISRFSNSDYASYICVGDPGITISATAFILAAYNTRTKSLDILKSYHHRNADKANQGNQKTSAQYAADFVQFVKDSEELMGFAPQLAIVDSFNGSDFYYALMAELRRQRFPLVVKFPIDSEGKTKKEDMKTRIMLGTSLLYRKKLRIMDTCQDVISDFKDAQYDSKQLEKGVETRLDTFDENGHADLLDCAEYAMIFYKRALE